MVSGLYHVSENTCARYCTTLCTTLFFTPTPRSLLGFLVFYFISTALRFGSIDLDVARCLWCLFSHVRVLLLCWTCSLYFSTPSLPRRFFCFLVYHAVSVHVFSLWTLPHRFSPTHVLIEGTSLSWWSRTPSQNWNAFASFDELIIGEYDYRSWFIRLISVHLGLFISFRYDAGSLH